MARLDGKRTNPIPYIVVIALIALLGAGGYVLMQNRGADGIRVQNGDVAVVDNRPGGLLEKDPQVTPTPSASTETESTEKTADSSGNPPSSDPNRSETASTPLPGAETETDRNNPNRTDTTNSSTTSNDATPAPATGTEGTSPSGEPTAKAEGETSSSPTSDTDTTRANSRSGSTEPAPSAR